MFFQNNVHVDFASWNVLTCTALSRKVHMPRYLGSSLWQAHDAVQVVCDGDVHAPGQVPRLADPRVVQAPAGYKVEVKFKSK